MRVSLYPVRWITAEKIVVNGIGPSIRPLGYWRHAAIRVCIQRRRILQPTARSFDYPEAV